MYKGLFWLADDKLITYKIECGADGAPAIPDLRYNSRRGDSFTHKATWDEAARNQPREIRSKDWNHFPRGRVEVKAKKVTVYHNPAFETPDIKQMILDEFALVDDSLTVRFVSDYSYHYKVLIK